MVLMTFLVKLWVPQNILAMFRLEVMMLEFVRFFSKPQGGLRSLQERQLQYEVETRRKYEQELEDLKARMKEIEDMFNRRQKLPTNHQTTSSPDEVYDH